MGDLVLSLPKDIAKINEICLVLWDFVALGRGSLEEYYCLLPPLMVHIHLKFNTTTFFFNGIIQYQSITSIYTIRVAFSTKTTIFFCLDISTCIKTIKKITVIDKKYDPLTIYGNKK